MRVSHFAPALCALAFAAALGATPARADDPRDPSMRSAEARARDKAIIRKLNEDQLAYVRKRDAEYARGWEAYRRAQAGQARHRDDERAYSDARDDYEAAMADWRRDVAACRAGQYERCAR
ncbi:hypothetical protein [Novosphingobium mangrovi (ex Huang et al. 2023)]|uniref:Uncharacterized protein n=1 Tax=Novosphingobium mangrovi (ex Huang et al. 2023) TaxID=2976432 RepID=A0ABT2I4V7_9SPHN|nr:hypothetical protein [Novosphingobium mangrovi (ex Huang et al. 2023)]MCT2399842.1 hypothetical protein [Novosphingobium mangrovi (ex Huang et al. 2023)]